MNHLRAIGVILFLLLVILVKPPDTIGHVPLFQKRNGAGRNQVLPGAAFRHVPANLDAAQSFFFPRLFPEDFGFEPEGFEVFVLALSPVIVNGEEKHAVQRDVKLVKLRHVDG